MKTSKSILSNNWVVTLSATLIGVFLALYLNEQVVNWKTKNQKLIATQNILAEISSNDSTLQEVIKKHYDLLGVLKFLGDFMDEEDNLIAPSDSLNSFRQKYPEIIIIDDSTLVKNNTYNYDGEINLNLSLPHLELTTIALKTVKNNSIISSYGFNCMLFLERLDKITGEILIKNKELFDYFVGTKDTGDKNEYVLNHLNLLIDYEESLKELYDSGKVEFEKCD